MARPFATKISINGCVHNVVYRNQTEPQFVIVSDTVTDSEKVFYRIVRTDIKKIYSKVYSQLARAKGTCDAIVYRFRTVNEGWEDYDKSCRVVGVDNVV